MAYRSLFESILSFNVTAWYDSLSVKSKNTLSKIVNIARKVIGKSQKQLCNIFDSAVQRKGKYIAADTLQPPDSEFILLPSGRQFRAPKARHNIHKKSFIPYGIEHNMTAPGNTTGLISFFFSACCCLLICSIILSVVHVCFVS